MTRRGAQQCPYCQATVVWHDGQCRGCGRAITISRVYVVVAEIEAIVVLSLLGLALDIRWPRLLIFVGLLFIPAFVVVFNITGRLFPPEHYVWDDYRLVLYGEKDRKSDVDDDTPHS